MPKIPIKLSKEKNDLLVKANQEVKTMLDSIGTPTTQAEEPKPSYHVQHRR